MKLADDMTWENLKRKLIIRWRRSGDPRLRKMARRLKTRDCGGCSLCCTVMNVPEVGAGAGEDCEHQCEAGCGIYKKRPQVCRDRVCSWLLGCGPDAARPDRSGVIIDTRATGEGLRVHEGDQCIDVRFLGPFNPDLAGEVINDVGRFVRIDYVGFPDHVRLKEGEPYRLWTDPETITRKLYECGKTGKPPKDIT